MKHIFILLFVWQPLLTRDQETAGYDFFSFTLDGLSPDLRSSSVDMENLRGIIAENNDIFNAAMNIETDPEFTPYIEKYIRLKDDPLDYPVKILFFNTNSQTSLEIFVGNALCDPLTRTIFMSPDVWETISRAEKEMLLFHELGHCDLNRKHEDENASLDRLPFSLMQVFHTDMLFGVKYTHLERLTNTGHLVESIAITEKYTLPEKTIFEEIYPPLYSELFSKRNTFWDPLSPEVIDDKKFDVFLLTKNSIVLNGYMLNFLTETDIGNIHIVTESWLGAMESSNMVEENKGTLWQFFRRMVNQAKNTEASSHSAFHSGPDFDDLSL